MQCLKMYLWVPVFGGKPGSFCEASLGWRPQEADGGQKHGQVDTGLSHGYGQAPATGLCLRQAGPGELDFVLTLPDLHFPQLLFALSPAPGLPLISTSCLPMLNHNQHTLLFLVHYISN